jgi:hypothetical protein
MTLHADLEKLKGMSNSLHGLADEASGLTALNGVPWQMFLPLGFGYAGMLSSVIEAGNMALGVQTSLIPTASDRLGEIGNLMHSVTVEFRNGDDADVPTLARSYTNDSGDWG